MPKKEMTAAKIKKTKTWPAFSLYIRTRDCLRTTGCASFGLCITCGKRYHLKLLQAGHFIPGRHNANLFHENGCHAQCYNCNINLKGNTLAYRDAIIKLYEESTVEELRINDRLIVKFKAYELLEMEADYKQRTKQLLRKENI